MVDELFKPLLALLQKLLLLSVTSNVFKAKEYDLLLVQGEFSCVYYHSAHLGSRNPDIGLKILYSRVMRYDLMY